MNKRQTRKTLKRKRESLIPKVKIIIDYDAPDVILFNLDKLMLLDGDDVCDCTRGYRKGFGVGKLSQTAKDVIDCFFEVDGVIEISIDDYEISIKKAKAFSDSEIIPNIIDRIEKLLGCKATVTDDINEDNER